MKATHILPRCTPLSLRALAVPSSLRAPGLCVQSRKLLKSLATTFFCLKKTTKNSRLSSPGPPHPVAKLVPARSLA